MELIWLIRCSMYKNSRLRCSGGSESCSLRNGRNKNPDITSPVRCYICYVCSRLALDQWHVVSTSPIEVIALANNDSAELTGLLWRHWLRLSDTIHDLHFHFWSAFKLQFCRK